MLIDCTEELSFMHLLLAPLEMQCSDSSRFVKEDVLIHRTVGRFHSASCDHLQLNLEPVLFTVCHSTINQYSQVLVVRYQEHK